MKNPSKDFQIEEMDTEDLRLLQEMYYKYGHYKQALSVQDYLRQREEVEAE